jgi:hypothetical protein
VSTAPALDPRRIALLAMDFQSGIIDLVPGAGAQVERVGGAIAAVRLTRWVRPR